MNKEKMSHEPCMDVHYQWSAGEVCFDCPCGEKEIIMAEDGDEETCDCGRVYKLIHFVTLVDEKKSAGK